ncbi:MAG: cell division protein ZapB [Candidatus Electrothrix sp. YB6]
MENNEELVRLERLVGDLIDKYNSLKNTVCVLEEKLRSSEEECELMKMELAEVHEQRSEVFRRVNGLLDRIEQWDSQQEAGTRTEIEDGKGGCADSAELKNS